MELYEIFTKLFKYLFNIFFNFINYLLILLIIYKFINYLLIFYLLNIYTILFIVI